MTSSSDFPIERIAEQRSSIPQYWDEPIDSPSFGREPHISMGYLRCRDFDESGAPGQDFSAFRAEAGHIVGVVVDGVSQSFFGNLAAQEVGKRLLEVLWQRRESPPEAKELASELDEVIPIVDVMVREQAISAPEGSFLYEALEQTRPQGSRAVFAAFLLDCRERSLTLYQLGDVYVWVQKGEATWIRKESDARGRWSSAGPAHHALTCSKDVGVTAVLLHSDGARSTWVEDLSEAFVSKEAFEREAEPGALRDDISFISVTLKPREEINRIDPPARSDLVAPASEIPAPDGTSPIHDVVFIFFASLFPFVAGFLMGLAIGSLP